MYKKYLKRTIKHIQLDEKLIKKAVKALQQYAKEKAEEDSKNLLQDDDKFITVNILLSEVPTKYSPKPLRITIPHPIYGPKYDTRACLFVPDLERKFLDKIEDLNLP